jgi:hypothetical protein
MSISVLASFFLACHFFSVGALAFSAQSTKPSLREKADQFLTKFQKPEESLRKHLYLSGNYAPVLEEHVQAAVTVVEGAIPKDLEGMFCRNGPNPIPSRMSKLYHWFDGYAMRKSFDCNACPFCVLPGSSLTTLYSCLT